MLPRSSPSTERAPPIHAALLSTSGSTFHINASRPWAKLHRSCRSCTAVHCSAFSCSSIEKKVRSFLFRHARTRRWCFNLPQRSLAFCCRYCKSGLPCWTCRRVSQAYSKLKRTLKRYAFQRLQRKKGDFDEELEFARREGRHVSAQAYGLWHIVW